MADHQPLLVIMGPTASGKSALALECAERLGGEIVSIDSMQIYRGLEIGTAQPSTAERLRVPHHLVGIRDWRERVEVVGFCRLADAAIAAIRSRGRLPVLAGGTGLYLKALLYGLDDLPADPALRAELDARYDHAAGEVELAARMRELDPAGWERWKNCRRRLIRALEVRLLTGKSLLELQSGGAASRPRYEFRAYRIDRPAEELKARIRLRAAAMLNGGWIEEAAAAIAAGLLTSPTAHQALGYRLIGDYLAGRLDRNRLTEAIATATWQFARRQRTWFRHQNPPGTGLQNPSYRDILI